MASNTSKSRSHIEEFRDKSTGYIYISLSKDPHVISETRSKWLEHKVQAASDNQIDKKALELRESIETG